MKLSEKQKIILELARTTPEFTKRNIVSIIGGSYFRNADKYVGEVLTRMVKSGLLKRIKNGVYSLGDGVKKQATPTNQLDLFNTETNENIH